MLLYSQHHTKQRINHKIQLNTILNVNKNPVKYIISLRKICKHSSFLNLGEAWNDNIILLIRYTMDRPRFSDHLEAIKFICKDFWSELFKKQIDNLKTNHKVSSEA